MKIAIEWWTGQVASQRETRIARRRFRLQVALEPLEERITLSAVPLDTSSDGLNHDDVAAMSTTATVSITDRVTAGSLVASNLSYRIAENTQLTINAPGVLAYVTPQVPGLSAAFNGPGPFHGALSSYSSGAFQYTPGINYTGQDTFTYQAMAGTMVSNTATVTVTIVPPTLLPPPPSLLPDTPYFNYVRKRRSIDPARFDYYHPRIGALLKLELSGLPATPTTIVPKNAHFNVTAERKLYHENPRKFDQTNAVLGALFQLETPGPGNTNLLPDTPYYVEQEGLYESNPSKYQIKNPYLGAIFAIESIERGDSTLAASARAPK